MYNIVKKVMFTNCQLILIYLYCITFNINIEERYTNKYYQNYVIYKINVR